MIELNLAEQEALALLERHYENWNVLLGKSVPQSIKEKKDGRSIDFRCTLITFAAQKIR